MMFAVKSKKIITPSRIEDGYILIEQGKIKAVVNHLGDNGVYQIIDVGNSAVMPGVIDPHVHINEPGRTEWEGFETATKAAIAGGVTMLVDMPLNSSPVTTTVAAFEEKLAAAVGKINTNVGFWGGVVPGNENEIHGLIENGVLGFKAFLTHSGINDFPNATEEDLRKVMPIIAKHKLPLLVHCELSGEEYQVPIPIAIGAIGIGTIGINIKYQDKNPNPQSYQHYLASRPKEWEDKAIAMMIRLCEEFNCHVHIVHLSSADSVAQIAEAKRHGLPLTVETAQHYLYFNAEDIADGKTAFKCAPPIREKGNNDLLWQALKNGIIDFVATDHSPAPPELKALETGDFTKAWGGVSSIQFALPVLWTAARQRGFSLIDLAKWLCENPAKLAGQKTKGKITAGYDADLIVLSDEQFFKVEEQIILHRHKVTPYLGETLYGVVEQVFLKGEKVFDNGTMILHKGKIIVGE